MLNVEGLPLKTRQRYIMNSSSSGSGPKRPDHESQNQPRTGTAGPGENFDPTRIPEETRPDENTLAPREAPAPGVPMSNEQYEWLKRKAKVVRTPPSKHKQEDPSAKGRK